MKRALGRAEIGHAQTDIGGDHAHHPTGWRRYVYSTNHKDIGTMYLIFAIIAGCIGGFFSMMMDAEGKQLLSDHSSAFYGHVKAVYDQCSGSFHTFKHGAFHGALLGIFTILPIIATGAMFERKGFKYIAINAGYWILCLTIMGAIVCHFMPTSGVYPVKGF